MYVHNKKMCTLIQAYIQHMFYYIYYSLSYSTHTDFLRVKSFESSIECTLHIKDSLFLLFGYDGFYPFSSSLLAIASEARNR